MKSGFQIQHVNILVDNLEESTRFYRDMLGLEPFKPPEQGFPSQFFQLNEHQQIHMNQIPDARPFKAHFCLVVPNFMAVFRRAKAAGIIDINVFGRIRRLPSGSMQMFLRDPSGNLVEISCKPDEPLDETLFSDALVDPEPGIYRVTDEPGPGRS